MNRKIELKKNMKPLNFKFKIANDIAECYSMILVLCDASDSLNHQSSGRVKINMDVISKDSYSPNLSFHEYNYNIFSPLIIVCIVLIVVNSLRLHKSMNDEYEPFNYLLLFLTITLLIEFFNQLFYFLYYRHLE